MKSYFFLLLLLIATLVANAQRTIQGNVMYSNNTGSYLDSVTVILKQGNTTVAQVGTSPLGYFRIPNIANGTYTLAGSCAKKWGGVNSSDASAISQDFAQINTLTGIKKKAADVNASGQVTMYDALLTSKRYVRIISTFPAGDWYIEPKTITVNGADVRQNLQAICFADVNGSYSPLGSFSCGQEMTDARDGKIYPTVKIGEQCWMAKNLNVGTFIYGVGNQSNNFFIEKYCYQNLTSNCEQFGGLYQWWEMMQYDTVEGIQGICPTGWHLPADVEWDTLVNRLGGPSVAGGALKLGGSSGFNALMAGWVFSCQKFRQMGIQAYFWSSTSYYSLYAWSRILTFNTNTVTRQYEELRDGLSVRCLKN